MITNNKYYFYNNEVGILEKVFIDGMNLVINSDNEEIIVNGLTLEKHEVDILFLTKGTNRKRIYTEFIGTSFRLLDFGFKKLPDTKLSSVLYSQDMELKFEFI